MAGVLVVTALAGVFFHVDLGVPHRSLRWYWSVWHHGLGCQSEVFRSLALQTDVAAVLQLECGRRMADLTVERDCIWYMVDFSRKNSWSLE